jgi:hypothetical protein
MQVLRRPSELARITGQVETVSEFDSGARFAPFAHTRSTCRWLRDLSFSFLAS